MSSIKESARAYEARLRKGLGREVVETDLEHKRGKLARSSFSFLRGSYWRWAETIFEVCPDLKDAPAVLAVGDIHLENFGTWRDVEGRLVWGVNDFDEAAVMPYVLDLARLATSALLARSGKGGGPAAGISVAAIAAALLEGYRKGLDHPQAIVLDRDWAWLRDLVVVSEKQRAKFWSKIEAIKPETAPPRYRRVLSTAMPEPRLEVRTARRTAGTGSLGRPRWVGIAQWRGAPVVREAKALLPSAWHQGPDSARQPNRVCEIAEGIFRSKDPWYRVEKRLLVRRLSPNNRKIEAEKGSISLLNRNMLQAMGLELASVHLGSADRRAAIIGDLDRRDAGWLADNAKRAAAAVASDHAAWTRQA